MAAAPKTLSLCLLLALGAISAPARALAADGRTDTPPDLPDTAVDLEGEVVVDLADDLPAAAVESLERRYGLHPNSAYSPDHDRIERASVAADREDAFLDRLSHEPGVEHAERMEVFRASFVPDDPLYAEQWHLARVGAESAWEYGCGRGVTVAVIDTGVACFDKGPFSRGSDLAGTRCERGYNFVTDSEDAADDQGHGTHVAGTIAQTTNNGRGTAGLAYCATLMPVKVLNRLGWGTLADVAEGIRFAADHGAQVINLSLGGAGKSRILEDAVSHALAKGVLVVAAAGNTGRAVSYPAAYDGVVAVSATDANDTIAWFSSRGPQIAIAAPGVGVTQQTVCDAGRNKCELFSTLSGTSMASPHVAGAAALVMGLGISNAGSVAASLRSSARGGPSGAADARPPELYGAGILDAGAAVRSAFLGRLGGRLGLLVAVLVWVWRRVRRRRGQFAFTAGASFGALLGATGLIPFLPFVRALPRVGDVRPFVELLGRPVAEWDVGLGLGLHRWLPLATALPVLAAFGVLFGVRRLRPSLGGYAAGTSAVLLQLAVSLDVTMPLGASLTRVWLVANALACVWLARTALDASNART